MKNIALALGCALALFAGARAGDDADNIVDTIPRTKIGTNKFALKGLKFRTTEMGKVREGRKGELSLAIGANMVISFEKATRRENAPLLISGYVTNDNIGYRMSKVQIVLGTASHLKGEIAPRKTFATDDKGQFEIKVDPKEGEVLYFVFEGWPIEEYAISELLAEAKG